MLSELLQACERAGVRLSLGQRGLVITNEQMLTPSLRAQIQMRCAEIITYLKTHMHAQIEKHTLLQRLESGCTAHLQTAEIVDRRWASAEAQNADVGVCDCCKGPCSNIQSLLCRRCDDGKHQ